MPRVTLYSLYDAYCGNLIYQHFFLDTYTTHEEYLNAVSTWLKSLSAVMGDNVKREQTALHDSQGIPERYLGMSNVCESYFQYKDTLEALKKQHTNAELILELWVSQGYSVDHEELQSVQ